MRTHSGRGWAGWTLAAGLAALLGLGAVVAVGVDTAAGARPVKGALYGDAIVDYTDSASPLYLRVSASGRWLNPRRSAIRWEREDGTCGTVRMRFGSPRHPVRITRSGRFRFVHRRGGFVFRMRGRFVTKNRAKVKFRYRREPELGRPGACEDTGVKLAPRRIARLGFRDCSTHKAKTLLRTSTGRVFRQRVWKGSWAPVSYACLYSANRLVRLGQDWDGRGAEANPDLSQFRLGGPYVAYALSYYDCNCADSILVKDLRSGSKRKDLEPGAAVRGRVSELVLKDDGAVAWIADQPGVPSSVRADDGLGLRQLDGGGSFDSLRLNGSTLTWRKDGVVRSATLY